MTTPITLTSEITVRLIQAVGSDNILAAAAKVSTSPDEAMLLAESEGHEKVKGLINYLMMHRHGTPFEAAAMTFYVHAPIFVWREWHRHRIGFSYNEESGRYKQLDPVFYVPPKGRPMFKVDEWKPGRPKFLPISGEEHERAYSKLCLNLQTSYGMAYELYESNLRLGIDPGLARDCLPVGIYSSCWVTCNPRSMMAFLSLRVHDPDAKFPSYPLYEIQVAAQKCEVIFANLFPITHAAFVKNGRVGP